jgi:hypothetical protein
MLSQSFLSFFARSLSEFTGEDPIKKLGSITESTDHDKAAIGFA